MFTTRFEAWVRRKAEALITALGRTPLTPNQVTVVGLALTVVAAGLAANGQLRWAGVVLIFAGTCDILDGALARSTKAGYPYGAFLDSTLDRVADGGLLGGLAVFYALNERHHNVPMVVVCLAGLIGAFLTSYIRARAEALGLDAKVGLVQRPERIVLLSAPQALFGLVLDGWVLALIILFLTVTAWITVVQRMQFVYRQTNARADAPPLSLPTEKTFWLRRRGRTGTRS